MKKQLQRSLMLALLMIFGTASTWALTADLSMDYELAGYKAKAFYDLTSNDAGVMPTEGDLRYREGYGLFDFGAGNRSAEVAIPVAETDVLVCQFADTQGRSVTINSISGCTLSTTLSDGSHLFFEVNETATTLTFNVGRGGCVVSVLVMEKDESAATADYTLNYVLGETIVKTITANGAVGGKVLTDASFFADDVKYFRADGEPESFTIAASGNTFTVKVREAGYYGYTLTDNAGATITVGSNYEGETVAVPYPRYQLKENTLYEAAVTNKEYRKPITLTADNATASVEYTEKSGVEVVFYKEGEEIAGFDYTTTGNIPVRASNAAAGVATEDVTITTLAPGKYKLHVGIFASKTGIDGKIVNFGIGENVFDAAFTGVNLNEVTSEEYTLNADTDVKFIAEGTWEDAQFDYIWIEKTGDIEAPVSVYTLAGTEDLTGFFWDPTQNVMTLNAETGLYEITFENITVSETAKPEFKVVKDGETWYPENNWVITPEVLEGEGVYTITITFNAETNEIGVTGVKAETDDAIYSIYYSAYTGFPFYVMGYVPEFSGDVMTDYGAMYGYKTDAEMESGDFTEVGTVTTQSGNTYHKVSLAEAGWHQYFIADGIPTQENGIYTVKAMVKASEPVTFNVNMGWGWGSGQQMGASVAIGTEWQEVTWKYEGVGGTSCNLVAQPGTSTATIEWKYVKVYLTGQAVEPDWTDIIVNGDMEGDDPSCFYVTEQGIGGPFLAPFTEGIGKDGSKAVKVESYDDPATDWDTQFFIRLPYQLPEGTKFKVSFDYKANKDAKASTQAHAEPGAYHHWAAIGDVEFTTEWNSFYKEGSVDAAMAKGDNGNGNGNGMQTIAFNLGLNKVKTTFIFDNVKFEIPADVTKTLTPNPAVDPKPYTKPVFDSMAIVGDFLGLSTEENPNADWDPANGWQMAQDAENEAVWTLVVDEFTAEAKTYEYKAVANGNWDDYVLPADKNADYNFDTANLGAGKYKLRFTVDTRKHSVNLDVEKLDVTTYTATFTTDAEWEEVYAYAWSGEEPNVKKFLGDWPGTKLEAVDGVYTVNIMSTDAPEKIIFNNGNSGEGNQTRDFEFENGGTYEYKKPTGEEAAELVAPEGWTQGVTNGNLAGDDVTNYVSKEYPSSDILGAAIVAGAGKDGSRGILVKAGDDTEHEGAQDWDSQFWIILNDELPSGSKLHVEFDYKASVAATSNTQSHAAPGAYLHWAAIGDVNFTTEWQHFSADVDINDAMAKGDNGNGSGTGMKSIAFNLAVNRNAVDYQFDNFGVWYQKAEPAVTIESMAIVGDFLGLEATEEDTNPNWNPANGWEMEKDAENPAIWTLTKPFTAEAKKYEYKATANGKWGDYELPAEGNQDFVFGTDEYPAGDYKLVFTADTENNTLDLVVKPSTLLTFTATFTTNAYWWDDVYAYAWSGEGENVTEYLGAWPGTKLKVDADGVYTVNVEGEVAPEKIVFNNGNSGEGNQTEDFEFVAEKAYEYVFTPTFDFENNNGQWAEGATFVDGVTMDEVTLTGSSDKVKYTKNQLRVNATHSFTLTAPEGKSITKIELKVLKESEFAFTASTGEVANTKTLKQGDEESQTTVYSIWTWTGNDTEVSFNLTDARQRNLGFINVTTGEITATDIDFTVAEGDIAAALEAEKAKVAKVGNITMRLNKDAAYTIGATLTAPNNFFFYGNDATVTVAAENADPFITLDGTEAFAMKSETEASDHKLIASVEVRGVTVKGLQNALIKDNQKTLVENVVVDYANIEMPANNKNVLDFNGKGYVGKATVTNSTIWAKDKNTGFFVQYGSRPKNINGDWLQEFDFENNTIVNIANGKNFCNFNQKGTAQNVYTVKNNIFVDCGKQNQVVVGFNSGQPSATPEWTVSGNYFEWGGVCVNAAETEKAGKKNEEDIVKDCVDGAVKFADAANGDFNGVFEIDAAATAPESLGAPMWTLNFVKVNTYTVTFTTNAGWEKAYAYAWSGDRETAVKFLGDWPGTEMTPGNGENDWMISFKAEAAPEKIIFNNGDNGAQTADLDFEDGKAYEFTINNEWADAIAAAQALAEEDGVAVGKLIAAIGEAQGIAEPSDEQKAALQTAVDQYKLDNADQEKDETAKVATNGWKKFDGSAAGVCATQYAPAITTYDGRTAQMAECYETNGNRTGTIIYQDITGLTNGKYKVGFYGNAFSTSQRDGFECTMEDGATDVAYVFANEEKEYISARIATSTTENDFRQFDVEVTDGNIKLGMGKDTEKSTNWHTIQIYQLTWFTTAKEVFAQDQEELKAVIAEAKALLADETKTEGKEALEFFVYAAEQAVDSKMINISELEAVIGNLKDIIAGFKKANWYIDFAAGEYYIIDVESGLKMAAGHDWGTRGIVNERGLDLTLTPYTESRTVTIDSRVYNGDTSHFLGENLYMDSSEWGWALEYQGFGFYILEPNGGKYINLDKDNNLVLSDTPREFIIVTKDGVRAQLLEELSEATKDAPVDATGLIVAQNFNRNDARNAEAWIVSEDCTNKNLSGGNNVNNCAESFHSTFTIMQTISDAPAGFYQLTAQGFYRQDEFEGDAPAAPQFFANEVNADVPAKTGSENGMSDASASFTNGLYTIEPINFEVKDDGMMYIGITASTNTQWVIWDNFQLKYFGQENPTTGITTVVVPVAQNDAIYNLSGQKVQNPKKGLYIVNGKKIVLK